jgi:hypothetical protein
MKLVFSGLTPEFDSQESVDAAGGGRGKGAKFFSPGVYDVTIQSVELFTSKDGTPIEASDPTWVRLSYVLCDGEKSIFFKLDVPTKRLMYVGRSGKETTYMFEKLQNFMSAIGANPDPKLIKSTLAEWFSDPEKQVGRKLSIKVGYDNFHPERVGDKWVLTDKSGTPVKGDDGEIVSAEKTEMLKAFCATHTPRWYFQGFPEVLSMSPLPGADANAETPASGTGLKGIDDVPF